MIFCTVIIIIALFILSVCFESKCVECGSYKTLGTGRSQFIDNVLGKEMHCLDCGTIYRKK